MPAGGVKRVKKESETSNKAKESIKGISRKDSKKKEDSDEDGSQDDQEYEVEQIEGHKISKNNDEIEFRVKWKGYPSDDNTWESFEFFAQDAPVLAMTYLAKVFNVMKVPKKVENFEDFRDDEAKKQKEGAKNTQNGNFGGITNLKRTQSSSNENQGPVMIAQGCSYQVTSETPIKIISQFEYGTKEAKMGFLIEIRNENRRDQPSKRDLIAEDELLKTHSKEMYNFLKSTLRYELKVPVKKSQMLRQDFDQYLKEINNGSIQPQPQAQGDAKSSAAQHSQTVEDNSNDVEASANKEDNESEEGNNPEKEDKEKNEEMITAAAVPTKLETASVKTKEKEEPSEEVKNEDSQMEEPEVQEPEDGSIEQSVEVKPSASKPSTASKGQASQVKIEELPLKQASRKDSQISQHKETVTPTKGGNAVKIEQPATPSAKKPATPIANEANQGPPQTPSSSKKVPPTQTASASGKKVESSSTSKK